METVVVPKLGLTMTEAIIGKWLVRVGDTVAIDTPLVEIETDKIMFTVNTPYAGTITELSVAEGETAEVGASLCVIQS